VAAATRVPPRKGFAPVNLSGSLTIAAPRASVWRVLNDPAVLQRHMPGCESLEPIGPDEYKATLKIGVAAIKGTYAATLRIKDRTELEGYTLMVEGSGAPGFAKGEGRVNLTEEGGGTVLTYEGDLHFGGLIARFGQRLLSGIAERMTREFFESLSNEALG
jgi:carbon monoxide dehydrogenase subunit G